MSETSRILLSIQAADRSDLLDELSRFVYEHGGNIEDTRMIALGGRAAILSAVSVSESALTTLRSDLPEFERHANITVAILRMGEDTTRVAGAFPHKLTASGQDQPGMLNKVSHLLRALQIDIDDIESHVLPPDEDHPGAFELELRINIPRETPVTMLRDYLAHLLNPLSIKWELVAL